MRQLPLYEIYLDQGAYFETYFDGWQLPKNFISVASEYKRAKTGNFFIDRTFLGKLFLSGKDTLDFLNRISTNDLRGLSPGMGVATVLTNEMGRMIDFITVYVLKADAENQNVLIFTSPGAVDEVKNWFNKLIIMDDVRYEDVTDKYTVLSLYGNSVDEPVEKIFRADHKSFLDISNIPVNNFVRGFVDGVDVLLARTDEFSGLGFNMIVKNENAHAVLKEVMENRVMPIGFEVYEILRVEAGIPAYGKEITAEYNPLEANLTKFVSFTKGCYIGQEVISRIDAYQKLRRKLVGLMFEPEKTRLRPFDNSPVYFEDKEIGKVTSVVFSIGFQKFIGLGYVGIDFATPGKEVKVISGKGVFNARIEMLPFSV